MFFKKIKSFFAIILVATFIMPQTIFAYSDKIIAGGESIGIEINSKGILVSGFYKIDNKYPGIDAGINKGDMIIKADGDDVNSIDEFIEKIKNSNQKSIKITYKRNKKEYDTNLMLINENNTIKTGLYVKDTITGIGTLSFIDPNTKLYGALGHEITDNSSEVKVDIKDGKIYESNVTSIEKSIRGEPGAKKARTDNTNIFGNINENTTSGIFGKYIDNIKENNLYDVASYKDIKLGEAKIITVLNGNEKKEYSINILKVNNDENDNKNILFEVTDKDLISKTGGIVQGMSGSPIVQGNYIVGAVTNVVVNNPKRGYGILITTMLKEAEN